ncbi:MAG: hypothetical protein C0518_16205 [Opitutus sp.]|nr:hypothetical protein [Opitutus sp.]
MKTQWKAAAIFLIFVGALLIVEGLWGLFSDQVFGVLTINRTRAVIHLALGIGAIVAAVRGRPLGYLTSLGGLLFAVAVFWSLPMTRDYLTNWLAINQWGAVVDFALGVACFFMSSASGTRVQDPELERNSTRRRGGRASPAH